MNLFIQGYRELCKKFLGSLNFQRKGSVFFRIQNDVFQNVYIEDLGKYSHGTHYRVCFGTIPLASKETLGINSFMKKPNLTCGHYVLKKFEVKEKELFEEWVCDNTLENIRVCLKDIERFFENYLIPFFENTNIAAKALPEVIKIEELFEKNRRILCSFDDMYRYIKAPYVVNFLDINKYYMALKAHDYVFARECCQALLDQNISAFDAKKALLSEEALETKRHRILLLKKEISNFEEANWAYFKYVVECNERESKEFLRKHGVSNEATG